MIDRAMSAELARVRALVFEPYAMFRVPAMRGRFVNVSDAGFREGAKPLPWPPDAAAMNAFVFGGSTAFGYGVADRETIPAQLGELLDAAVYNFATPNSDAPAKRIRFEQLLVERHVPRVAIFLDGFDELVAPFYAPMMQRPLVEAMRRERWWMRGRHRDEAPAPRLDDVLDRYVANVRMTVAIGREFGVRSLHVWQPAPCYRYEGNAEGHGDSGAIIEFVRSGYDAMSRRRSELAPHEFLWLADMQAGRADDLYVDADHYTAAFSRDIAATIAWHLREHGFVA